MTEQDYLTRKIEMTGLKVIMDMPGAGFMLEDKDGNDVEHTDLVQDHHEIYEAVCRLEAITCGDDLHEREIKPDEPAPIQ